MRLMCFDIESSGVDVNNARIVEIGYVEHDTDTGEVDARSAILDPGIPIPRAASEIHGIYDGHVQGRPKFDVAGPRFLARMNAVLSSHGDSAICGYNATRYDVPLFNAEMARAGHDGRIDADDVIDPLVWIRKTMPQLRSKKLANAYVAVTGQRAPDDAHRVLVDCRMTVAIAVKLLNVGAIPASREERKAKQRAAGDAQEANFGRYGFWLRADESGRIRIACGKHSGKAVDEVEPSYLGWVLANVESLTPDTRAVFEMHMNGATNG